jgi:hypothetical protein
VGGQALTIADGGHRAVAQDLMELQSLIFTQDFLVSQSTARAVDKSTLSNLYLRIRLGVRCWNSSRRPPLAHNIDHKLTNFSRRAPASAA